MLPLAKDGWSSIHSVIDYEDFWNIIDMLKKEGAEDILVCPIEKIIVMEIIDNPNKEKWKEICSRLNSSYKTKTRRLSQKFLKMLKQWVMKHSQNIL